MLGKNQTDSTADETRADRVMGREDETAPAASSRRDDAAHELTQPIETAGSGVAGGGASRVGGSTSAKYAHPATPEPDGSRNRSSYAEDDHEPTRVQPIPTKAAAAGVAAGPGAATTDETRDLEAERTAERERRRADRERALGTRHKAAEEPEAAPVVRPKRTTDKFFGALGLFLLRLVAAGIIGLHGLWKVMNLDKVEQMLGNTIIPQPQIMSYVLAASEIAIALGLLFGLLTRLAGLGLALVGIGALVFVKWVKNPFTGYQLGGELELLLGTVGVVFLLLGAGGWSVDAALRRRRAASKRA